MVNEIKISPYLHGCFVSFTDDITKNADFVPINSVSALSIKFENGSIPNPAPVLEYAIETVYKRYYDWRNSGEDAFYPLIFFFRDRSPYPVEQCMPAYKKLRKESDNLKKAKNWLLFVPDI